MARSERILAFLACALTASAALVRAGELPKVGFRPEGLRGDGLLVRSARDDQKASVRGPADFHVVLLLPDEQVPSGKAGVKFGYMARSIGVTLGVAGGSGAAGNWTAAGFDKLMLLDAVEGLRLKGPPAKGGRKPDLSDPAWRASQLKRIAEATARHKGRILLVNLAHGASCTRLADPTDAGPNGIEPFRAWLKAGYGALDALNRAWSAEYKNWAEAAPRSTSEVRAGYAKYKARPPATLWWKSPNMASWSDVRTFNDAAFAETLATFAGEFRKRGADVPVGFSGLPMPAAFGGYDPWRLSRAVDFLAPEPVGAAELIARSFNDKRSPIYVPLSGRVHPAYLWGRVLDGDRGAVLAPAKGAEPLALKEPAVTPTGKELARTLRPLAGGIVRLLSELAPADKPTIAVHCSQRSVQADWMFEGVDLPGKVKWGKRRKEFKLKTWAERTTGYEADNNFMVSSRESLVMLLEDMGCPFEFVSSQEVAAGELQKRGYKVFWMPRSMAVSKAEAKAIVTFAEAGGTVVADLFPGRMDGHCRMLIKGYLDDLFGVKTVLFRFPERDRPFAIGDVTVDVLVDQGFAVREGTVGGRVMGRPVLVTNSAGKGRAVLLAFDCYSYVPPRGRSRTPRDAAARREALRGFFGKLLADSGVKAACQLAGSDGKRPERVKIRRWAGEDLALTGIVAALAPGEISGGKLSAKPAKLTVGMPGDGHVYDLATHKHYGKAGEVQLDFDPARPAVLAQVPYEVKRLEGSIAGGKVAVRVITDGPTPKLSILHVEVFDAGGTPVYKNSANYVVRGGVFKGQVEAAKAAVKGRLRLRFTEVLSGKSWETEIAGG